MFVPMFAIAQQQPAVAFYYGDNPPMHQLRAFDWVVVEPGHLKDVTAHNHAESMLFAYVSLGEVSLDKPYAKLLPSSWLKGDNSAWQSKVIDQTAAEWPKFVLENIITPLWQAGYRGFFLDTLDSFNLIADSPEEKQAQIQGLLKVIKLIKSTYPESKLIFNRGFELLPQAIDWMDALAFESWFAGYRASDKTYAQVPQADRDWLAKQLEPVQQHGIPIIAIDYVEPESRDKARMVAQSLINAGFIPWVGDADLSTLGVGLREVKPRRVLMVTPPMADETNLVDSVEVMYASSVLNVMGYAVDYAPINQPLPSGFLADRYAGLLVWVTDEADIKNIKHFPNWLLGVKQQGLPMLIVGNLVFLAREKQLAKALSLKLDNTIANNTNLSIAHQTSQVGYETTPMLDRLSFYSLEITTQHQSWLTIVDGFGNKQTAIAITSWGGLVAAPNLYNSVQADPPIDMWIVNPFALFEQAFRLEFMPMPDTTSEAGRRLLMVHHDGDGFPSRAELPGNPFAGKVLLDEIVKKYPIPMSLSTIEAEVGAKGLYAPLSPQLEPILRQIYQHAHVEIASHTYSHPFDWAVFAGLKAESKRYDNYNLSIAGYVPSLTREVEGSVAYINDRLAPKDKKVALFNWSGDCNPPETALALVEKQQISSINGGNTVRSIKNNSMTKVSPVGLNKGQYFQVFAPVQNENVFTNDWTGPFNGYKHVLETFQLTEHPKRIKPVNIYFHTYSLSKYASIQALKEVFDWAIKQPLHPVHTSEYVKKAQEFNRVVVAKDSNGQWLVRGLASLQQLRIPKHMGYPNLDVTDSIVGYNDHGDERFLHAYGSDVRFTLIDRPSSQVYLKQANASVTYFKKDQHGIEMTLVGYVKPQFELKSNGCSVKSSVERLPAKVNINNKVNYGGTVIAKIQALCRP